MAKRGNTPEQILSKLREAEVHISQGSTAREACRQIGVTLKTYYLWRQEGLKVPARQPKRKRLWLNDSSCIRLRPLHKDHVWSYDFIQARTGEGKAFRVLNIVDEYTRECLSARVGRPHSA